MSGAKTHIMGYGIKALRSRHLEIRKLKRFHKPSLHGFRSWPSSWVLMDFIESNGLTTGSRVLDIGCGWGLGGIYCAKNFGSVVTGFDIDPKILPYLRLHADINGVKINTITQGFDELSEEELKNFDVIIGADICFWDSMIDCLKGLILRAVDAGIQNMFIADPGRSPFEELGRHFIENEKGEVRDWTVNHPYKIRGRVLKIDSLTY